jgi:hypothetical protein
MALPEDAVKWAVQAFRDGRNDTYNTYRDYLDGKHPLMFATAEYRSAFGLMLSEFRYNRCGMVVDAHADRLQVEGFNINDDALGQEAWNLWSRNRMRVREGHAEIDTFGLGDSYLIVEMHPERARTIMWVEDPRHVRVHYDENTPGELDLAAKMWTDPDTEHARLNLYFKDRAEKYISSNRAPSGSVNSPTAFKRLTLDGQDQGFALNIKDTVPVFHIGNNARTNAYGRSELHPVIPLQDAMNKTIGDLMIGQEYAAWPQKVMMGLTLDDNNDPQLQAFQAGIKRIWTLEDPAARIAEFSAANLAQHLAVAEFFDKAISRVTKVPVHYLGMTGDVTSGISKRIIESPFTAKLEDSQIATGYIYSEAVAYGLRLEGRNVDAEALEVVWKSAAPLSEEDELDMAQQKVDIGFPFETILREMGRDEDYIAEVMELKRGMVIEAERAFNRGTIVPELDDEEEVA